MVFEVAFRNESYKDLVIERMNWINPCANVHDFVLAQLEENPDKKYQKPFILLSSSEKVPFGLYSVLKSQLHLSFFLSPQV